MKITKAEWDRFWSALGSDWYMDEHDQTPEDEGTLQPGDTLEITYGNLLYQGERSADPRAIPGILSAKQVAECIEDGDAQDLLAAFRRWRKSQNVVTFAIECPTDKADVIRDLIKNNGGKVL